MTSSKPELVEALRDTFRENPSAGHPTPEALADYLEDRLLSEDDERVQAHLVGCEQCSALLLELDSLKSSMAEGEVAEFATAAAWRSQRERLFGNQIARGGSAGGVWMLAASLAVVTVGLAFWIAVQRATISELRAPQVELPIANLEPTGSVRDVGEASAVVLSPRTARWVLILNLIDDTARSSCRLEFLDPEGRVVASLNGLDQSSRGGFRLSLPRDFLPPGVYRIRLSGADGGETEVIEEYVLRIKAP